jgi:hypothetical protein
VGNDIISLRISVGKVADTDTGNTKLRAVDRRYFVNSTAATGDTQDAENCIGFAVGIPTGGCPILAGVATCILKIFLAPPHILCYHRYMNSEYNKLRVLYTKMIESAQKGNDTQAFECARDISNSWYFKLFNESAQEWVHHILIHYNIS